MKIIKDLIDKRPNKSCYIASQQLGGLTHLQDIDTSFLHRDAIWKPWINGAWSWANRLATKFFRNCWARVKMAALETAPPTT